MVTRSAIALAALIMCSGASAQAGVQVVGSSHAHQCMDAAFSGERGRGAIERCTVALGEEGLDRSNRAGTLVNRGVIYMNRREFGAALADFEAALQVNPQSGEAYFNRGSVRIAQGLYPEGVSDIEQGLQLGMRQPEKAYYNRALAREALDDTRGAYLDYRQAARLKPGWTLPQRELARFTVQRR